MLSRNPFRLVLAGLILALGYGWIVLLFVAGAALGMAIALMLPVYFAAVPVILSNTHALAASVLRPATRAATLPSRPHAPSIQSPARVPVTS